MKGSTWISNRESLTRGTRYRVMYRRGGRKSKNMTLGTFADREEAEQCRLQVRRELDAGRDPKVSLRKGGSGGMITIQPADREGKVVLLDSDGTVVGAGIARQSRLLDTYVTIVAVRDYPDGAKQTITVRVPADWISQLEALDK